MLQNYTLEVEYEYHPFTGDESRFSNLTCREREILFELVKASNIKVVAKNLNISRFTVNQHLRSIYTKLGVNTKLDAVIYFLSYAHRQTKKKKCKSPDEIHCRARQVMGCEVMLCHLASFCVQSNFCMLEKSGEKDIATDNIVSNKRVA